jgi:hypothetical protein
LVLALSLFVLAAAAAVSEFACPCPLVSTVAVPQQLQICERNLAPISLARVTTKNPFYCSHDTALFL